MFTYVIKLSIFDHKYNQIIYIYIYVFFIQGFVQKMRAMEEALVSDAKEEEFHLKMIGVKANRRIEEHRSTPIDLLAAPIHLPHLPYY